MPGLKRIMFSHPVKFAEGWLRSERIQPADRFLIRRRGWRQQVDHPWFLLAMCYHQRRFGVHRGPAGEEFCSH